MPGIISNPKNPKDGTVLDLTRISSDIAKMPPGRQMMVGGASGWVFGYVLAKIGKCAAFTVGGSLLLLQVASYKGYIRINWNEVDKEINSVRRNISKQFDSQQSAVPDPEQVKSWASRNRYFVGGFGAGSLFGIGSA